MVNHNSSLTMTLCCSLLKDMHVCTLSCNWTGEKSTRRQMLCPLANFEHSFINCKRRNPFHGNTEQDNNKRIPVWRRMITQFGISVHGISIVLFVFIRWCSSACMNCTGNKGVPIFSFSAALIFTLGDYRKGFLLGSLGIMMSNYEFLTQL